MPGSRSFSIIAARQYSLRCLRMQRQAASERRDRPRLCRSGNAEPAQGNRLEIAHRGHRSSRRQAGDRRTTAALVQSADAERDRRLDQRPRASRYSSNAALARACRGNRGLPSQGVATTFGTLNVHTEPSRQSPSFVQVKEHEKVDVIAHKVSERHRGAREARIGSAEAEGRRKRQKRRRRKFPRLPLRPRPRRRRIGSNYRSRANRSRMPSKTTAVGPSTTGR